MADPEQQKQDTDKQFPMAEAQGELSDMDLEKATGADSGEERPQES